MSDQIVTFTTAQGTKITAPIDLAKKLGHVEPEHPTDDGVLKGAALDEALKEAGLPVTGKADEKRAALAEWQAAQPPAEPPADPTA
jgi:hypothetical protein